MIYVILSLILAVFVFAAKNPATIAQDLSLGIVNILTGVIGIYRIRKIKANDQEAINRKAIIGAQHSWLVLSLTTAVLALLFGRFFEDTMLVMIMQYLLLTVISVLAIYIIILVAMKKLPILE
jgi:peptidoglycan/LPS O-acetylase OafA/YrhL